MGYYDEKAASAEALLDKRGRTLGIVTSTVTAGPDAAFDPSSVITTESVVDTKGLQSAANERESNGSLIPVGMRKYLLPASVEIPNSARIRDGDTDWSIVEVMPVQPGPVVVLQKVFVEQ